MANAGAFKKGEKRPNQGRPKGMPNKSTVEFRQTVQKLLDENRENVARWLTLVAEGDGTEHSKPDPGKALDLLSKLAEFAAPKLARTEITGENGGPVRVTATPLDEAI
jgi:hypothetical protein